MSGIWIDHVVGVGQARWVSFLRETVVSSGLAPTPSKEKAGSSTLGESGAALLQAVLPHPCILSIWDSDNLSMTKGMGFSSFPPGHPTPIYDRQVTEPGRSQMPHMKSVLRMLPSVSTFSFLSRYAHCTRPSVIYFRAQIETCIRPCSAERPLFHYQYPGTPYLPQPTMVAGRQVPGGQQTRGRGR